MTNTTTTRITLTAFIIALNFLFASAAPAVTENECVNGGGSVSAGSGCKFCVGGKHDLSEIKETVKNDAGRTGTDQKTANKSSARPGAGAAVRTPAGN